MLRSRAHLALLLIACAAGPAMAAPISADFALSTDDGGGKSFNADFSVSPGEHLTFNAGVGRSEGSDDTADLSGTVYNAGASLHGDAGGFSLGYDAFNDGSNYSNGTFAARGWLSAGDFEFALLARHRTMNVGVTLELPLRTVHREADFAALGGGFEVSFARGAINAYVMALHYDYDDDFDNFVALSQSPQLQRRPRIEALVGSFLTQAQGAIDRQYGAGFEYGFGRHSLGIDVSSVHDALLDSGSVSLSLTWRYAQSARRDWSVSAGMADSDAYGDIAFVGVSLGITN